MRASFEGETKLNEPPDSYGSHATRAELGLLKELFVAQLEGVKSGIRQDRLDMAETLSQLREGQELAETRWEAHSGQHDQLTAFQKGQRATFVNLGGGFKVLAALGAALLLALNIVTAYSALNDGGVEMVQPITCASFQTHAQAQIYFENQLPGYARLDGDGDGQACE